ncbi:MAG: hypothetical protein OXE40_18285 [Gammaproteobacteria bacterium]|nr:hypothetical protein [Gammaproteobacteria bacterium]
MTKEVDQHVDQPVRPPETASSSTPGGSARPEGQGQQGAMAGRRVTESPPQARGLSLRQGRQAGATAAAVETQPSLHSRHSTATPSSPGREVSGSGAGPNRRARSAQAPHREPENAELDQLPAKRIKPDPASGFTELPWLTPHRNTERRALHDRLTELRQRPEAPSKTEADPDDAVGLVFRFEREVLRADELLSGLRTKLLSEAEWRELTYLVERARSNLPLYRGKAPDMLERLVEGGALSSAEAALLKGSLQRLVDAHEYLCSEELPWGDVARRVELPLGEGAGTTAVVESRVIPGTAFGERLARGYFWDENARVVDIALTGHVPCLAQTTLTDATGRLLFSGLRQGFIGISGLHDGRALSELPDADLRRLVSADPIGYHRTIEQRHQLLRRSPAYADCDATFLQNEAAMRMVLESAAAAVCADPDMHRRALGGKTIDVKLFDIALLTGNEFQRWTQHYDHLRAWHGRRPERLVGGPIRLGLRGPDNEPCHARANVNIRLFALSVEDQGPDFSGCVGLKPRVAQLLGPTDTRELTGDVRRRVQSLRIRAAKLGKQLAGSGYERVRTLPSDDLETRNEVARLQAELAGVEKTARALEQAGQQLKDLWVEQNEWPSGADAYRAASRLALIGYLMGETPVLSSMSGRGFADFLDVEVKILATVTDCQGGHVPPARLDTDSWDAARTAFASQQEH